MHPIRPAAALLLLAAPALAADGGAAGPDFDREIRPVLTKYCAGCHNAGEASGEFALHDFDGLMRGGYEGAIVAPGDDAGSRLFGLLDGSAGALMPPEDEPRPTDEEVELLRAWVRSGAHGGSGAAPGLVVPEVTVTAETLAEPVHAVALAPTGELAAVGRYGRVELRNAETLETVRTLVGVPGHVHAVGWLDAERPYAAAGEPGLGGAVAVWDVGEWSETGDDPAYVLKGHADAILAAALSPADADGNRTLATGGYDQTVRLWDPATGLSEGELKGHNGPVYAVAFHPTLPLLATASGDRTVKLWDPTTGELNDTLTEPAGEQLCVAFSPDGRFLLAAGGDRTLRAWELTGGGKQGTTRVRLSQFVHRGPVLAMAFLPGAETGGGRLVTAAEDATVKLWERASDDMLDGFKQAAPAARQGDWPAALAVAGPTVAGPTDGVATVPRVLAGLLDGSLKWVTFDAADSAPSAAGEPADAPAPTLADAPGAEVEPNDSPAEATPLAPSVVSGVIAEPGDEDYFRFAAGAGEEWALECVAKNPDGSGEAPTDPLLEILHPDGTPVIRVRLRATRASAINFRPIDSMRSNDTRLDFWDEMELNEYLYMSGEVVKLFRAPQGPDSGFVFYERPKNRHRINYFGTSATAHALFEPVYTVEPHPPGTDLPDNGLPVFDVPYASDDDPERELGNAARMIFTAPAAGPPSGTYLARVRDVRGEGGPAYGYELTLREPDPGFSVWVTPDKSKGLTVPAGSGEKFTVWVDRRDGWDGPVTVAVGNLPPGISVGGNVVVQAGHFEADGVLRADPGAATPTEEQWNAVTVATTGTVGGEEVVRRIDSLGPLTVADPPPFTVTLEPDSGSHVDGAGNLVIRPGETITAKLSIDRSPAGPDGPTFEGESKFDVQGLPHGVIVDNIGLSGVLVRVGEDERQIFLTAADWVPPSTRPIFAESSGNGDQCSGTVSLRVAAPGEAVAAD